MEPAGKDEDWTQPLRREADAIGKPAWRPMLRYAAELHRRSIHPAAPPFEFPWQDTGPGYGYGPAFGHWDIVHQILDVLPAAPEHARRQLLNDIRLQLPSGFIPGLVKMPGAPDMQGKPYFYKDEIEGHPPLWVAAAKEYLSLTHDRSLLYEFYERAATQIGWFETHRRAQPDGFFYNDIIKRKWESGVDEGVRFDEVDLGPRACIDATSHVYQLCACAAEWAAELGINAAPWQQKARNLSRFVRNELWDEKTGFFYDHWAIKNPTLRRQAFDGMWPLVVGIPDQLQADRVIDEWLLNPQRFFTAHPISTVGASDEKFELRMWRGPTWNSMTYWAAQACLRYSRPDAALKLIERALDDTAAQFDRTGTIWEYYHPHSGKPEELKRKPQTQQNQPFRDYLGHNPVFALARLWQKQISPTTSAIPKWCWPVLTALLLLGAYIRFHNIERNGLWVDEMWALMIACGRGVSAFHMPANQILNPPPQLGLAGASPWWHIWTNIGTSIHPPLYLLTLRAWMTIFGQTDVALRSLSAVLGLLGIILLFDVVRRTGGNAAAICAAAAMTLAVSQIDFAQEVRGYTMIVLLGLLACRAIILIEQRGTTKLRLLQLTIVSAASFLTHYFTAFSFGGLGLYILWRLRGSTRIKSAAAIASGGAIAAAAWGPWFLAQYRGGYMTGMLGEIVRDPNYTIWHPLARIASLAAAHLYGTTTWPINLAVAMLVFVLPLVNIRRAPNQMMWWFWAAASIGGITLIDMVHHTFNASNMRYTYLATPALCALVTAPLPMRNWTRWLLPATVLCSLAIAAAARFQYGEPYPSWPLFSRPDFRALAQLVDHTAGPDDTLVFAPDPYIATPVYFYESFNHYAPDSRRPVVILSGPASPDLLKQLATNPRVYLIAVHPMIEGETLMPGWKPSDVVAISNIGGIARIEPPPK